MTPMVSSNSLIPSLDWLRRLIIVLFKAEITSLIAADVVHDFLSLMLQPRDDAVAAETVRYNPSSEESGKYRDEL